MSRDKEDRKHKSKHHSKDKKKESKAAKSEVSSASSDGEPNFDLSAVQNAITKQLEKVEAIAAEEGLLPANSNITVADITSDGNTDNDNLNSASVVQGNFYIHGKRCLNCVHLCPTLGKKSYSDCHYTNGNDSCPASETRIVVMLPYEIIADRLFNAHMQGDAATLASLNARLNRQDKDEVEKVLQLYGEKMRDHYSQ